MSTEPRVGAFVSRNAERVYCTKSLLICFVNSFANRRGLGRVKEGFGFSSHLLCPVEIRQLYVLGFMVSNTSTKLLSGMFYRVGIKTSTIIVEAN